MKKLLMLSVFLVDTGELALEDDLISLVEE